MSKSETTNKPIWIILDDGDTFEGHQGHFADSFFSNATEKDIRGFATAHWIKCKIRPMTDKEIQKYPEAVAIAESIRMEYE